MDATPIICPACGELVIAWPDGDSLLVIPIHLDRITPAVDCLASARAMNGATIRQL